MRRRTGGLLVLALVPLVLGGAVRLLTAAGAVPDERLDVSALAGDWVLALGALVPTLGVLAVLLGRRAASRAHRDADARVAAVEQQAADGRRLLLSRLDHELKNPLMAMRAAVANVAADDAVTADPGTGAGLRSIDQQVVRLSRLTADLRKIADVELRGVDRRPVDLAAILLDAVEAVRDQGGAEGRDVRVSLRPAEQPDRDDGPLSRRVLSQRGLSRRHHLHRRRQPLKGAGGGPGSGHAERATPSKGVALSQVKSGGDLLSHAVPHAVPSARTGLASGFGMGPGVSPTL